MRIQVVSDVHLEMRPPAFSKQLAAELAAASHGADVLVNSGDTSPNANTRRLFYLNLAATGAWKHIVVVYGNHDYWHGYHTVDEIETAVPADLPPNVHILQRRSVLLEGVTFLGCTLWSHHLPGLQPWIRDYEKIHLRRRMPLTLADVHTLHDRDRQWLTTTLPTVQGPRVVVTHHAPSMDLVRFARRPPDLELLSAYYNTGLDDTVAQADLWIYGHTHDQVVDGNRVSNPLGYPGEVTGWGPGLVVDV